MTKTATPELPASRRPTGRTPWPVILLEGEPGAAQLATALALADSRLLGATYVLDLEAAADEHGTEESRYEVLEHDGTWRSILAAIEAVHTVAAHAAAQGDPPIALIVDNASVLWRALVSWTYDRARRSAAGQRRLRKDADAAHDPGFSLWDDTTEAWSDFMWVLRTMAGPVVVLARGRAAVESDESGLVVPGQREIEGHKALTWESTVWVRLLRGDERAHVIASHTPRLHVPDDQPALLVQDFSLERLLFETLGCSPAPDRPVARPLARLAGDAAQTWLRVVAGANTVDGLREVWDRAQQDAVLQQHPEQWRTVRDVLIRKIAAYDEAAQAEEPDDLDKLRLQAALARRSNAARAGGS